LDFLGSVSEVASVADIVAVKNRIRNVAADPLCRHFADASANHIANRDAAKIMEKDRHSNIFTHPCPSGAKILHLGAALPCENRIQVEIIDLRTLNPFDWETIATSVRKTNRVIVAYEDMLSWGYGAEVVSRIADDLFDDLDAPVKRGGARDTFVAYQPVLEDAILPQPDDVYRAIVETAQH
jgi:2-oxoisovalerate dehydrogenase E1 component